VSAADIAEILAWHAARETCAQLANRLGLSVTTVRKVVRSHGRHYKKPPPEEDGASRDPSTRVDSGSAAQWGAPFSRLCGPSVRRAMAWSGVP
jgi:hypothetical protein